LVSCHEKESNFEDTKEYQLYMEYLDQVRNEGLKFYQVAHESEMNLKEEKRTLEMKINEYIQSNDLYFDREPTEEQRIEFLNELNNFINSQDLHREVKENLIRYWALVFNPKMDELKNNFLKTANLEKEQLLTVLQNRNR
jgi:hypothetical protein